MFSLLKLWQCIVIYSKFWSSLSWRRWYVFLSKGTYCYLYYLVVYTNQLLCVNRCWGGDWELSSPVLYFELGSFTHKHTHEHDVPLLTSCSGKNLIAVNVKILYIETFVEVAKTACIFTFCCSFYILQPPDDDELLPTSSSSHAAALPALATSHVEAVLYKKKAYDTKSCLLLTFICAPPPYTHVPWIKQSSSHRSAMHLN